MDTAFNKEDHGGCVELRGLTALRNLSFKNLFLSVRRSCAYISHLLEIIPSLEGNATYKDPSGATKMPHYVSGILGGREGEAPLPPKYVKLRESVPHLCVLWGQIGG